MIRRLQIFTIRFGKGNLIPSLAALLFIVGIAGPMLALAQSTSKGCWAITGTTTNPNSYLYTDPGTVARSWIGAADTAGQGAYPMTISVNIPALVPDGTLLGSGVSSINNLGGSGVGSYSPEQVLFRCSPDADGTLYEYYATNGDAAYAGATDVSAQSGIPGTYLSYYTGVASRITNIATGDYLSRAWKARPLTGLDRDTQGWILVKAKNFSQYKLEMFQCTVCQSGGTNGTGSWAQSQPQGYVAFVGGATGTVIKGNLAVGADSASNYSGWYSTWPGAINAYQTVTVRRAATCAVTNATPLVRFPIISVRELNQGNTRQLPVTIQMQCQSSTPSGLSAFISGTAANQTALGVLVQPANAQSAIAAGLKTAGSGVTYLLSDGYGTDLSVATGVGVALSRPNGTPLNLLTNQYVTTGGTIDGWDSVLNDATANGPASGGVTSYTRSFNATLKAFAPGVTPVTAGRFNATAQVIVRVQ
ncbi:type 1 fimbria pilin [Cupriavidus metallidurans]|jgi:type 1 fimbria pilin|uniref:fimbrial protein n=1 Tax=Cupriavidus metallidurans TaxID=119219 RepID=UPI002381C14A|nr:fimbrial protein [Cupriavidus metallidurans]MDE4917885.1 fimbrial protein [Cupriavidus metallidurans]